MKWGRLQRMIVIVSVMFIFLFAGCGDTNQSGSKAARKAAVASNWLKISTWTPAGVIPWDASCA